MILNNLIHFDIIRDHSQPAMARPILRGSVAQLQAEQHYLSLQTLANRAAVKIKKNMPLQY